ncbi:hypothetical protein [Thermococcus sp.]|uniref:hypothetical protein n=1 Tax=Thermococcus sp. TaxID=35749 RepID=UPI0025F93F9E|nr:hypothetical protein [Thermococcus sp.]
MKWKPLFAVLLGLLMVGVTAGSAAATSSPAQNSGGKVVFIKDFQTKLLVNTPTRQLFTFGDLLVDYRTNGKEAKIIIKNTTTSEIIDVVHITSTRIGDSYLLTVKDASGVAYSTRTPINMVAPGLRTKQLISKPGTTKESSNIMASTTQQHYWWDGVYFVKGYMIKYPHPDYKHYGIEPWDTVKIKGNKLTHLHFSQRMSEILLGLGPTAVGAYIGFYAGSAPGAVIAAIAGFIAGVVLSSSFVDEYSCLWVWVAWKNEWHWQWTPPLLPMYVYGPVLKYLRIGPSTLKNDYHIPNP